MNLWQNVLDSAALLQQTVVAYQNPNNITDKNAVNVAMTKELIDLGVAATTAGEVGGIYADLVESAGGGATAPADILQDFTSQLSAHKIVLPEMANYFLMIAATQAVTTLHGLVSGGK